MAFNPYTSRFKGKTNKITVNKVQSFYNYFPAKVGELLSQQLEVFPLLWQVDSDFKYKIIIIHLSHNKFSGIAFAICLNSISVYM